jgi:manganese-dependent inorganic pyrophosphatase
MKILRAERGYAALLFMVVDIVHSQTEILVVGMEEQVAEAFDQRLASPNSVMMGGVMSRKKQVVPILPRVARLWKELGN